MHPFSTAFSFLSFLPLSLPLPIDTNLHFIQWLEVHANKDAANCPVCKSGVYKADLIPIYGRGKEKNEHAMFNAPPRPAAQRVDPVRVRQHKSRLFFFFLRGCSIESDMQGPAFPHQWNGNMGGNFTFTAGFGFFPMFNMQFVCLIFFSFFAQTFFCTLRTQWEVKCNKQDIRYKTHNNRAFHNSYFYLAHSWFSSCWSWVDLGYLPRGKKKNNL